MTKDHGDAEHPIGLALACALSGLAGAVDACGLARLHDLFVSFMSGNTTSLGVALGGRDWTRAGLVGGLVGLFVVGAAMGEMVAVVAGRWRLPVVTLLVAAGLAGALAAPDWTVTAMVLSMGALNAAMQRARGTVVGLTYVTGTLVRFGLGLGRYLCRRGEGLGWLRQTVPWLGLVAGAAAATLMQGSLGAETLWPLPAFAAAVAIVSAVAWAVEG